MTTVAGVVVAGGRGRRFGGAKQNEPLAGRPLWQWAHDSLMESGVDLVVVVGGKDGPAGGLRRRDSVLAGLRAVGETEYVLVHDAARPLATSKLAGSVIARLQEGDVAGVIPVLPLRDAIKRVDGERIVESIDRSALVAVQTPQGFVTETLLAAHGAVEGDAADDAELVHRFGGAIATVAGEFANIKVTFPDDMKLAEALYAG